MTSRKPFGGPATASLLLASLGIACSSSSSGGGGSTDGGNTKDGGFSDDASGGSSGGTGSSSGSGSSSGGSSGGSSSGGEGDSSYPQDGSKMTGQPVNLGSAGNYVILAKTGISTVPTSAVTGNLGISPAAASYITGFSLTADATNVFSTSPQVTGQVFASDYAPPTPSNLTTAIGDMLTAFTDAAGRAPGVTELGAGNIGGMTLAAGVYGWSTGLLIPTNLTLDGSATDVWILQIAQNLTVSNATNVVLSGGAQAQNVFWEVAGAADIGTTSQFQGIILSKTTISLHTGATITGRLLAQTAVSIDSSAVTAP